MKPLVSALVVNYNSAGWTRRCVASLLEQDLPGPIEVLVVDNASRPEDRAALPAVEGPQVRVLFNEENVGYGPANNQAFAASGGEFVYVSNPDVKVLPGALRTLVEHLRAHPDVGAAGPKTWMDDGRSVLHPPNIFPTLGAFTAQCLAQVSLAAARRVARARSRRALRIWEAAAPIDLPMLSGAAILTRRALIDRVGFFDPEFPLYFEDTDWFVRVRRAGGRLVQVPAAEIIHYFSRSAVQDYAAALERNARSEDRFFRKYHGPLGHSWYRFLSARVRRRVAGLEDPPSLHPLEDLGLVGGAPVLRAPGGRGPLYAEIAGNALFSLAAGQLFEGTELRLSPTLWESLWDGAYFVRVLERESGRCVGAWRLRKGAPVEAGVRSRGGT